jgi:hypothetical protein
MPEVRVALTVVALLAAMVLAGALGRRQRTGVVLLALLSLLWLLVNHAFEGPVLFSVTSTNGLTASDLVGLAGFVVSVGLWLRLRRR